MPFSPDDMSTLLHGCGMFLALWLINKATQSGNQSRFPASDSKWEVCQSRPGRQAPSACWVLWASWLPLPQPSSLPSFLAPRRGRQNLGALFARKKKKSRSKTIDVTCIKKENAYLVDLFQVKHVFLWGLKCLVFVGPGFQARSLWLHHCWMPRGSLWSWRQHGVMGAKGKGLRLRSLPFLI